MDVFTFLRERVGLFASVSDEHLTGLAVVSTSSSYKNGQTIMFKGATVDGLRVMAVGRAGVFIKPPTQPVVQVAELACGDVFGETSIIENGTAGATIKALEDGTVVLNIPQEAFRVLLSENPEFMAKVTEMIAARRPPPKPRPG